MIAECKGTNVKMICDKETHQITVICGERVWTQDEAYLPCVRWAHGDETATLYLRDAEEIAFLPFSNGVGEGVRIRYGGFPFKGDVLPLRLETVVWLERETDHLFFELVALQEAEHLSAVDWPAPFSWDERRPEAYSLFPQCQGTLIPSDWPHAFGHLCDPVFFTIGACMPWFGQVTPEGAYLQIAETPWDCGYHFYHAAGGPTGFHFSWLPSLGALRYRRVLRTVFFQNADYTTLCKAYRRYVREKGRFKTLRQKELDVPAVTQLIGSPVIHSCIDYHIVPEARIYKKDDPAANHRFSSFAKREEEIRALTRKGLKKGYLHLDGWGVDGYDQQHPDILPVNRKAGGAAAMRALIDTCHAGDILFAIHDQYRDQYLNAATYDVRDAVHAQNGAVPGECTWNGGRQTYLCAALAGRYLERNLRLLEQCGVQPDGVYLDVFSAVEPDECFHTEHRMDRRECSIYRAECLERLRARGLIASSESGTDNVLTAFDICHHIPYPADFMEESYDARGIRVPLWELVYHDCAIVPWALKAHEGDPIDPERMLQAALNGGTAYLDLSASAEEIAAVEKLMALHEKVAREEMLRHEFLDSDRTVERTVFTGGICVTADRRTMTWTVTEE